MTAGTLIAEVRLWAGRMPEAWHDAAPPVRSWWMARRDTLLRWGSLLLIADALVFLSYEFWRLLAERGMMGAVDFHARLLETKAWFDGMPVYGHFISAFYPPATYALMWPFTGWLSFGLARLLWAAVMVVCLAWFGAQLVRGSTADQARERILVLLVLLATYPAGQTVGDGQFLVPVLPLIVCALLLLRRRTPSLQVDLVVAVLLLLSLVKPTAALPFLVVACCMGRLRAIVIAVLAYVGLTVLAASYQPTGLFTLLHQWATVSKNLAAQQGVRYYANVQTWLGAMGLRSAVLPVSLVILVAFAYWAWRHRSADLWLLIGVAALVSRFWTYHSSYDDILIVLPLVALFRIAKQGGRNRDRDVLAGLLFAATLVAMLAPDALFVFPFPLNWVFTSVETALWLGTLAFLLSEVVPDRVLRRSAVALQSAS
jgi:hypothetical protein